MKPIKQCLYNQVLLCLQMSVSSEIPSCGISAFSSLHVLLYFMLIAKQKICYYSHEISKFSNLFHPNYFSRSCHFFKLQASVFIFVVNVQCINSRWLPKMFNLTFSMQQNQFWSNLNRSNKLNGCFIEDFQIVAFCSSKLRSFKILTGDL